MNFVQPLFLIGLLGAAIPLVVHLINRRKAVQRPFPALRLLQESNEKIARSIKVRQWVLLALRMLVVAAIAIALAKPYLVSRSGMTAEERLPAAVVFVVDTGFSMGHGDWWPQARRAFDDQLGRLRPWDEVALVTTTSQDAGLPRLTSDQAEARRAFGTLEVSDRTGDLGRGLVRASEILAGSQQPNRRIVLISDFSRNALASTERPDAGIPYPVERVSVRGREAGEVVDNLAVVGVDYVQEGTPQERTWRIDASVRNFGASDARNVTVRLRIGEQVVTTDTLDVDAGKTAVHTFRHRIDTGGVQYSAVEIEGADHLAADDVWHFTIHPRERVRALLVNGQPGSVPYDDELFFLLRALSPGPGSESTVVPAVTTIDGLDNRELANFDVVVLANVPRVSAAAADRLEEFVESGGGLFITVGDQVDPQLYNQQFANLLPRPLRGLKLLAERTDPDAPVKITRLGHAQRHHPIFRVFNLPGGDSIQSVQVYSYMLLDPAPADDQTRLLLSYQDNAPALLERQVGQGRVILLTTTVDRDWSDLPIRTAYLPLMRRSMMYLARRSASRAEDAQFVGQRVRLEVAGLVQERALVHTPTGGRLVLDPLDGEVSFDPERAGYYEVWADDDQAARQASDDDQAARNRLDQFTMAVNVDRAGSDLHPLDERVLDAWLSPPDDARATALATGPEDQRRVNLWSKFLFVVTLMLLAETVLGARRSVLSKIWRTATRRGNEALS